MSESTEVQSREGSIQRYESFLFELYVQFRNKENVKYTKLAEKHRINKAVGTYLERCDIVDKSTAPHKWIGGKPSREMAVKVLNFTSKSIAKSFNETKATPVAREQFNALKSDLNMLNKKVDILLSQLGVKV